jgi:hypothetical protein
MIGNKSYTEAADGRRKSFVVEERRTPRRSHTVRSGGARAGENAGMSNDNAGENPARRKPKVSWGR